MKKILAILMPVAVLLTSFATVPVLAQGKLPANIASDYVPDESTRYSNNIVTTGTNGVVGPFWEGDYTYGFNGAGGADSMTYAVQSGNYWYFKPLKDVSSILTSGTTYPAVGFNIKTTAPTGATGRVVYSLTLKDGVSPKAVINIGRRNNGVAASSPEHIEYPIEYNGVDKGITPTAGYTAYTGTFADKGVSPDKYTYVFGFVKGSAVQATTRFDTTATYIGYEYAYDIDVEASQTEVTAGKSFTVDADILNQIGKEFGGSNDVTWYALNTDRTKAVDGFTITEGDSGTATISVDSMVLSGTYSIVAVSDENKDFVKGIKITVKGRDFSDYVPKPVTGNLAVTKDAGGNELFATTGVPFDVSFATRDSGKDTEAWAVESLEDIDAVIVEKGASSPNGIGAAGTYLRKDNFSASSLLGDGKNIVFGAKVKSTRGTPTVQLSMYQWGEKPIFAVEYPEGLKLSGTEWTDFTGTIKIPETGWKGYDNTNFYFGFAYTGLVDECQRGFAIKKNSVYIGEEYAYDMAVASSTKNCMPGKTSIFTVSAKVYNQVGSVGYLNQDVTWYALNSDRTAYVSGISVIENSDGTATVSVAAGVPEGTYNIVAVSDTYEDIQKGVTIKVQNPYTDYIPGDIPENLITANVTTTNILGPTWMPTDVNSIGSTGSGDNAAWTVSTYKQVTSEVIAVGAAAPYGIGVGGASISKSSFDTEKVLAPGKNMVIGAKVKKTSSWSSSSTINVAMYQLGVVPTYPAEYPNYSNGFAVNDASNWQDFGATLHIPEDGWKGTNNTNFYMGFVYKDGAYEGSRGFAVKKNSFYIAEECAYDIQVTTGATEWEQGKTAAINLTAKIINQVGTTGYLNQDVTWHALDCTRTSEVSGIEINEKSDGSVTVTVDSTVPAGIYDIVAVSDVYEGFAKGVRINVVTDEQPSERVLVFNLTENGGAATLNAAVVDTDREEIFFAIASYDENNKMIKSNILPVSVVDGVATVSGLYIDEVEEGYKVRGFVWENNTWSPINFGGGVENTIIVKERQ